MLPAPVVAAMKHRCTDLYVAWHVAWAWGFIPPVAILSSFCALRYFAHLLSFCARRYRAVVPRGGIFATGRGWDLGCAGQYQMAFLLAVLAWCMVGTTHVRCTGRNGLAAMGAGITT